MPTLAPMHPGPARECCHSRAPHRGIKPPHFVALEDSLRTFEQLGPILASVSIASTHRRQSLPGSDAEGPTPQAEPGRLPTLREPNLRSSATPTTCPNRTGLRAVLAFRTDARSGHPAGPRFDGRAAACQEPILEGSWQPSRTQ